MQEAIRFMMMARSVLKQPVKGVFVLHRSIDVIARGGHRAAPSLPFWAK